MKIGLLSDIHGNAHALKVVLKSAKDKGVEKLLCTGDYVGYYYEPHKVMEQLNEWDWIGVSGNHEAMLLDWINGKNRQKMKKKYGTGIEIAAKKLSKKTILYLCNLPHLKKINIDGYKLIICHGSPWDRDFYIYSDTDKKNIDNLFNFDPQFDLMVYGHTHYHAHWERNKKIIINPSSLGQSRDKNPGACWAIWDSEKNSVDFLWEEYNPTPVIEMCEQYDPEFNYLADVLVRT